MNYREKGELFCSDINSILKLQDLPCALVTGGGFAYDSIKYNDDQKKGDYDFMIVYQDIGQVESLIKSLSTLEFDFEKKYLDLDMELLRKSLIDIIRLSGKYKGTKSTINLVPVSLIDKVVNLEQDIVIKKIAHNRNTGLFFAYGSDNSRIIVNFLSPSFVTADGEDHYIHLDFTNHVLDNNIYLGILSDAILKGFNKNFDTINFQNRRMKMLQNINDFFRRNKIDNTNFINLFANHNYFPKYLKERLLEELNGMGKNSFQSESVTKEKTPIIMTTNFDSNFIIKPFNFINSKQYQGTFKEYISKMQNLEYDRQYLIDALAKFFGYVLFSNKEVANSEEIDNIIDKLEVYGMNDLYMEKIECYSINSIFSSFLKDLEKKKDVLNPILYKHYALMVLNFLSFYNKVDIVNIAESFNLSVEEFVKSPLDSSKMQESVIENLNSFEDIGMYHNYTSKVMPNYTSSECDFLENVFEDKSKKVLDVMCGYGRIANELVSRNYQNVYGVDCSEYSFLNVDKDFNFTLNDFFKYRSLLRFDYLYSLYNCYENVEQLKKVIDKMTSLSSEDAIMVLDVFCKEWRDSIDSNFYKLLFESNKMSLEIKRRYDSNTGLETTNYIKSKCGNDKEVFTFTQKFFTFDEIAESINQDIWNMDIISSSESHSRKNNQKNMLVLRKK